MASRPAQSPLEKYAPWWVIALLLAHLPLALAMKRVPVLALAHAFGVLALGIGWALRGQRRDRVACVAGYLVASEVLWRMTNSSTLLPWEFGKYAVALLCALDLARHGRSRIPALPLAYFLLLLPAVLLTVMVWDWTRARKAVSFNLSGPLALMLSVAFFSQLKLSGRQWLALLGVLLGPVLGVASLALHEVASSSIAFGHSSNVEASGGFGPNQVSSVLGLGLIAAFLCAVDEEAGLRLKLVCLGAMLVFAIESALTLSRSGLYLAALSMAAAGVFLAPQRRVRVHLLAVALTLGFLGWLVFPRLDAFAHGAISARFQNTKTTGRDSIVAADLKIFQSHPLLGVGVGVAKLERKRYYRGTAAHTEFSRLLAEHGLLGALAMVLLLAMALQLLWRAGTARRRAAAAALLVFALLFMAVNGMRLALPSFAFGLAAVTRVAAQAVRASGVRSGTRPASGHRWQRRGWGPAVGRTPARALAGAGN